MSSIVNLSEDVINALILREKLAFVGRLLKGIVHNISGAVQVVRLPLDLLELRLEDMTTEDIRKKVASSQEGLTRLTTEIGMLASRCNQTQRTTAEPLDLGGLLRDQLPFWKADPYFKHQTTLNLRPAEPLPLLKAGYADVAFAVNAVIANAVESMAANSATEISMGLERAGSFAEIEVTDSGPGPAPDMASRMFEPFATDKGGNHDGLGLFLANRVLSAWGGEIIWEPSRPTTFRIRLPID